MANIETTISNVKIQQKGKHMKGNINDLDNRSN